jgi:hypothetical protein
LGELLERHLTPMLATDESLHQEATPDEPPNYLYPFI